MIADSIRKSDQVDAQMLARLARVHPKLLSPIVHRKQESYPDIIQLKARDLLVKNRTRLIWPGCRLLRRLILAYWPERLQLAFPRIADQFEREANNFARFTLFQGDAFASMAADCAFEIKTPMRLAKEFGASVYAGCREFARTHHRACVVYVLEPIELTPAEIVSIPSSSQA